MNIFRQESAFIKGFLRRHRGSLAVLALLAVGFAAYSNTFHTPFHFDDGPNIVTNRSIRNIRDLGAIWNFWPTRLVTFLSFAVNYHFQGLDVFGYHLVNWLIHLGSTLMVLCFMKLIFASPKLAGESISRHAGALSLLSAGIFLTHPVQTESVTYIFQRTAALAGFLYLSSVVCYMKARLRGRGGQPHPVYYVSSWLLCLMGMLTKENAVTLPLAILLVEGCFFGGMRRSSRKYVLPFLALLPLIPLALLAGKPPTMGDVERLVARPVMSLQYGLAQLRVLATYLRLLVFPFNQNLDYDYSLTESGGAWFVARGLLLLGLSLGIAIKFFARYRLISFGIFWFFLTLLPESSFVPLLDVIFEHRLYLPMAGFSFLVSSGGYYLLGRRSAKAMALLACALIGCYSALTYARNAVWKDEISLWGDVVRKSPRKARGYMSLGFAHMKQGDFAQAEALLRRSVAIDPRQCGVYVNLCQVYAALGKVSQALSACSKAVEINPKSALGYNSFGAIYHGQGQDDIAIRFFTKAIETNPYYAEAYSNLGVLLFLRGDSERAIVLLHKAIELEPFYAEGYGNLGSALAALGQREEAILLFEKALELKPDYREAAGNLEKVRSGAP